MEDGAGVGDALTGDDVVGSDVVGVTVDGAGVGAVLKPDDVVGAGVGAGVGSVWSAGHARWATYDATVPPPACSSDFVTSAGPNPAWLPEPFASQLSTIWPHRSCKTAPP